LADRTQRAQDLLLVDVHRARDGEHDVRPALELREILARVVARLAEPAAVEETDDGHVLREVEDARRARARLESFADLGIGMARDRAHDRRLAGLHLTKQPDDRRAASRKLAYRAVALGIRRRIQNDAPDALPFLREALRDHASQLHERRNRWGLA